MKCLKNEKSVKIYLSILMILVLVLGCSGNSSANSVLNVVAEENEVQANLIAEDNELATNSIIEEVKTNVTVKNNQVQTNAKKMCVKYSSHIQDIGWEIDFSKTNGETSGTTGQNKKNEAIKIKLENAPEGVGVTYQSYLQGLNWQNWVENGKTSGTTGQNRKLEAIKIKLTGTNEYSIEYRTHVQDTGWMEWKKDGEVSGIAGRGLKVEAIEIRLVPKTMTVMYQSHVQDIGWEKYVNDGEVSGTVGRGLKVEAIKIELKNTKINIKYQTHIQDIGWESSWKQNGQESGTTGQNKKIEAIKIVIDDLDDYSVMYRAYLQGQGWQEWKKDGQIAGTTGQNRKLEAIEIKIVKQEQSTEFTVRYQSHVQDIGWQNNVKSGQISGVVGRGLKVEAIKITGKNIPKNVKIKYKTHIQDIGWENNWKENGQESGTTGQNKKIESIMIKLEGTEEYSITYRTYIQGQGWQEWANDGEISGTTGKNLRLEAIEIKVVPKIKNKIKTEIDTIVNPNTFPKKEYRLYGWLMTDIQNVKIQVLVNDKKIDTKVSRVERQDVLNAIKGYGGQDKNPKPGYDIIADFSKLSSGNANIKIQFIGEDGKVLSQIDRYTYIKDNIDCKEGTYGKTGLRIAGRGGSDLKYYKYGNGENVFFATFAIHGYEDLWAKDGQELVTIANNFYNRLKSSKDYDLAEKWTIYIFPGVNQDGLNNGSTNNGPGRTTLFSMAPNNRGIDLNRCWQIGVNYTKYKDNRNYNGTKGFEAYEAQYLRDFFVQNKSQNGQTVLVDLHGWTQQLIGDPGICSYYEKQFPENDKSSVGRYGSQYMINWARIYLASNYRAARSALIELPHQGVRNHQSVIDKNFSDRYINATLSMLKSII